MSNATTTPTPAADPLGIACPKCSAPAGEKCKNYKGQGKFTCKARVPLPCGCPGVVNGLEGAHLSTCGYPAAAARKGATMREFVAQQQTAAPAPIPDDFDENTPRPRARPRCVMLKRFTRLPPGEELVGIFEQWDREYKLPAGCILTQRIGIYPVGEGKESGYKLLATTANTPPIGSTGELKLRDLDDFKAAVEIVRDRDPQRYVIFAPMNGGR